MVPSCDSSFRELLMAAPGILRRVSTRCSFALCRIAYASSLSSLKAVSSPVPIFALYSAAAALYLANAASCLHCTVTNAAASTAGAARAAGSPVSAASPAAAGACAGTCGEDDQLGRRPPQRPEAAAAAAANSGKPEEGISVVLVDISAEDIYWEVEEEEEAAHTVQIIETQNNEFS